MAGVSFLILAHLVAWPLYSQPVCGGVEAAGKYILKFVTHGLRLFNGYMVFDPWRSYGIFSQASIDEHLSCFLVGFLVCLFVMCTNTTTNTVVAKQCNHT